ncbi:MAG: hypothetical protein K8I00_05575, partial [Candidatus Omnitrophica bacterium]|nr:hypothetical protein [Candidatus Omnitrophota bacterium]
MPSLAGKDSRWFLVFISLSMAGHGLIIFQSGPNTTGEQYANRFSEQVITVNLIREKAVPLEVRDPQPKKTPAEKPVERQPIDDRSQAPIEVQNEIPPLEVLQVEALRVEAPRVPVFKPEDDSAPEGAALEQVSRTDVAPGKEVLETPVPQAFADAAKGLLEKAQPLGHVNRKPRY